MNITLPIPDDVARKLEGADNGDLARRALEALALEEFRAGRLNLRDLREMLGFDTRYALDGFLKQRGLYPRYGIEDLEQDRNELNGLGLY